MTFNRNCPFCKRIGIKDYDTLNFGLGVVSFKPLSPVTPGHRLFVPRNHYEHDDVGASKAVGAAFEAAHLYAGEVALDSDSFNLITSYGAEATQTVPHVHIHLIPRRAGDGLQLPWGLPHGS